MQSQFSATSGGSWPIPCLHCPRTHRLPRIQRYFIEGATAGAKRVGVQADVSFPTASCLPSSKGGSTVQFGMIFWFLSGRQNTAACDRQFHRQVGRGIGQILGIAGRTERRQLGVRPVRGAMAHRTARWRGFRLRIRRAPASARTCTVCSRKIRAASGWFWRWSSTCPRRPTGCSSNAYRITSWGTVWWDGVKLVRLGD